MTAKKALICALFFPALWVLTVSDCRAMPKVERTVLDNGLKVLVFEDHTIPEVTIHLLVSAGSWRDPVSSKGLADLTAKSMLLGTRDLSFEQINDRLDFIGASLDAECRKDFSTLTMQVLKKDLATGFGLFLGIVADPSFPESDIASEKDRVIGNIRSIEDDPVEIANRAFEKALFIGCPYASEVEGTEESVAGMSRESIAKFYGDFYRPNNSLLVIGGDITAAEVKEKLVPGLLQWRSANIPDMKFVPRFAQGAVTVRIDKPFSQATVVFGSPALERTDKDYYPFLVMNNILGSGNLSSRLMVAIRVKMGLAYSVQSVILARKYAGSFRVVLQTKDQSAKEATALAIKEVERIRNEPVSDSELERAKKFLIGNFPLRFSSTQQDYARFVAQVEFLGLGQDYPEKYPGLIRAVTPPDILRVARKYLKPEEPVTIIVGDLKKAGM